MEVVYLDDFGDNFENILVADLAERSVVVVDDGVTQQIGDFLEAVPPLDQELIDVDESLLPVGTADFLHFADIDHLHPGSQISAGYPAAAVVQSLQLSGLRIDGRHCRVRR